jgi:hypothetical protein
MTANTPFGGLSNDDLMAEAKRLASRERDATTRLIACLMELDERRLYLQEGCASLFSYCTQVLRLSEHAAYGRIEAARAARRFPVLLERLASAELTLTSVALLARHLTTENHLAVLDEARHKTKRDVELIVARLQPLPDVPAAVRKLPVRQMTQPEAARPSPLVLETDRANRAADLAATPALPLMPSRPSVVAPIAPERFKVQLTMSRETHDKLRRAQDLLRHSIVDGDLVAVLDKALTVLLRDLERTKFAATDRPRPGRGANSRSRRIPAVVRRSVWNRDGGRCRFSGPAGRCADTSRLEFHHVVPFAVGGETSVKNIELRCRAHNQHEARLFFTGG